MERLRCRLCQGKQPAELRSESETYRLAERPGGSLLKNNQRCAMNDKLSLRMARHVQAVYRPGMMKWHYEHGLVIMASLEADPEAFSWAYDMYDPMIARDGTIATYREGEYNLDQINAGRMLFQLYDKTKEERFRKAADKLRNQLRNQPRTNTGVFWHKEIYPWQIWLDGLYMEGPFYAEYCMRDDDEEGKKDIVRQLEITYETLHDPKTGLLFHAYDESRGMRWSDPHTGCSPHVWGRALGWYCMACLDVLDYIPNQKGIEDILKDLIPRIQKNQDTESGMWYQVMDEGDRKGNYLETSASSMFAYTFLKATRKQIITDTQTKEAAQKSIEGIKARYLDANLNLGGICSVAGLGGNPYRDGSVDYYIREKVVTNDFKGVGPFILAELQNEE